MPAERMNDLTAAQQECSRCGQRGAVFLDSDRSWLCAACSQSPAAGEGRAPRELVMSRFLLSEGAPRWEVVTDPRTEATCRRNPGVWEVRRFVEADPAPAVPDGGQTADVRTVAEAAIDALDGTGEAPRLLERALKRESVKVVSPETSQDFEVQAAYAEADIDQPDRNVTIVHLVPSAPAAPVEGDGRDARARDAAPGPDWMPDVDMDGADPRTFVRPWLSLAEVRLVHGALSACHFDDLAASFGGVLDDDENEERRYSVAEVEAIDEADDAPPAAPVETGDGDGEAGAVSARRWYLRVCPCGAIASAGTPCAGFPGAWDDELEDFSRSACLGEVVEAEEVVPSPVYGEREEGERDA